MRRAALALAALLVLVLAHPAAALSVTQTIFLGSTSQPFGVAQTPDGHLYVSNNGTNTISVVDPAAAYGSALPPTITVGHGPGEIAIDPVANRAYVGNYNDQTTSVIDISAGAVLATLQGGGLGVAVDPGLGRLYVAYSSKLLVFDTVTLQQVATLLAPPGSSYFGVAVDTSRHLGYIGDLGGADYSGGGVVVFDLQTNSVITTVSVGGRVRFALTADPARGRVFVATDAFGSTFSVIDSNTNAVVGTLPLPGFPSHIAVYAADRVYVTENAQTGAAVVTAIDPATAAVTHYPIYVNAPAGGPKPAGLALVGPKIYVALNGANVLAVMDESAPVVSTSVSPSAPKTNDTLTATVYASDADGDPLTYAYQWLKNGAELLGATGLTLDLSVPGNGDHGDTITFRVTVSDGTHTTMATSQPVVVADTAPIADSATITPSTARTNDVLTASATGHDADGDALTYAYQWTKNGADIAGATAATLDLSVPGNGDRGDSIAVRVTASDGSLASASVTAAPVVVADSAPVVAVSLEPADPTTQTVLTATVTAADADNDPLTFTYVWKVNGALRRTTVTAAPSDTFDLGKPGNGNKGDVITVDVSASDGTLAGTANASVTVAGGHR